MLLLFPTHLYVYIAAYIDFGLDRVSLGIISKIGGRGILGLSGQIGWAMSYPYLSTPANRVTVSQSLKIRNAIFEHSHQDFPPLYFLAFVYLQSAQKCLLCSGCPVCVGVIRVGICVCLVGFRLSKPHTPGHNTHTPSRPFRPSRPI